MPGCQCRVNIFVLMDGLHAEAAIINACWGALLKLGLPMSRSICALGKTDSTVVASLFGEREILYGKYTEALTEQDRLDIDVFGEVVRKSLQVE